TRFSRDWSSDVCSSDLEKQQFRDRAEDLRRQVAEGADFATIARLYSQDPGSAPYGGDLGFNTRDGFVKEFSAVAFRLKPGELSRSEERRVEKERADGGA